MTVKQFVSLGAILAVTIIGGAGCTSVPSTDGLTAEQRLSKQLASQRLAEHRGGVSGSQHDRNS